LHKENLDKTCTTLDRRTPKDTLCWACPQQTQQRITNR